MELPEIQRLGLNGLQFDYCLVTCSCTIRLCCLIFIHFNSAGKVIGKFGSMALRTQNEHHIWWANTNITVQLVLIGALMDC